MTIMNRNLNAVLLGAFILLLTLFSHAPAQAATLNSIDVTPANSTISVGQNQPFTATGTFSDGSTGILPATPIAAAYSNTCALLSNGTVSCWGDNSDGQLGDGTTHSSSLPVAVSGISAATAIAAGDDHACALLSDRTVKCWGRNWHGGLGDGTNNDSSLPVAVSGISNATAIAAETGYTCALLADGTVNCWGWNDYGQLGDGTTNDSSLPVAVSGISNATTIAAGEAHSCAVLADGTVNCWGRNAFGQLGDHTNNNSSAPVEVSGISNATAIAAGLDHTCAVLSDGTVKCWGWNNSGQLGDSTINDSSTPVAVSGISNATVITAGFFHTCAVPSDGQVKCWGDNSVGQLGDGTTNSNSSTPVALSFYAPAAIAAGGSHTCMVFPNVQNGGFLCWGSNGHGQLGNGTTTDSPFPNAVSGTATQIAAGGNHACALVLGGTVQCWGDNTYGELGMDNPYNLIYFTSLVSGISNATGIATGRYHSCALLSDGTVRCWGRNDSGQLGDGNTYSYSFTPVTVTGISTATAIAAGSDHTCARLSDGTIKCWGDNAYGQLGDGDAYSYSSTPVTVATISHAMDIAVGAFHTCAVLTDETVKCWGDNGAGQLGNGSNLASSLPVGVYGIGTGTALAVAAGDFHTCAAFTDGTLRCWGANNSGQLGDGTMNDSSTPVTVSGISNARDIAGGAYHTCSNLLDGSIRCWGYNHYYQLGDGPNNDSSTPVKVLGLYSAANAVLWSSSDPSVATVDADGLLTGLSVGTTTITATFGGISGSTTLTVATFTPSGSNVTVSPGSGVTVTFSSVTTPGNTIVTTSSTGPSTPAGFQLGNPPTYYEISTTAAYTPPVTVCLAYNPALFANPNDARLLHYENNNWVDVTISNDTINHIVCGQVNSFSPFVIAQAVAPADLVIDTLTASPNLVAPGQAVTVKATVRNKGTIAANNFAVDLYKHLLTKPGVSLVGNVTCNVVSLAAGATTPCTGTVTYDTAGNYRVRAQVDTMNAVIESNEKNNLKGPVTVRVRLPDLRVITLTASPIGATVGQVVTLTAKVMNIGIVSAGAFEVDLYKGIVGAGADVTCHVDGLASMATATCTGAVTYDAAGTYSLKAQVDTTNTVTERSEANNAKVRTVTIRPPNPN